MTPAEQKLAAYLLDMAADTFSNHGCNDLKLRDAGLTPKEVVELQEKLTEDGEIPEGDFTSDWLAMRHCARAIRGV